VQNTNQGAAVSDRKAIFVESQDFSLPHLHSRPPLGGSRRNIAMPFGMEKLEWYPMVDKCWRYVYSFLHDPRTWQTHTQTDVQTDTSWRQRQRGKNHLYSMTEHTVTTQLYLAIFNYWVALISYTVKKQSRV